VQLSTALKRADGHGSKKRVVGNDHAQVNHFLFCPGAQAGLLNSGCALTLFLDRLANFCGFKRNHEQGARGLAFS